GRAPASRYGGVRFAPRLTLQGPAYEENPPAFEVEHLVGQSLDHELDCLRVDLLRVLRIDAVVFELDRCRAASEADVETPAAQLVEHADFFDQPQWVVERHRPHQRPEPKTRGALRHGGKKHARRGRHAERRRAVLGEVGGIETGPIGGLGDFEAILVAVREGTAVAVEVIEDTEFHLLSAFRCWRRASYFLGFSFFRRCASVRSRSAFSRMNPSASRWS